MKRRVISVLALAVALCLLLCSCESPLISAARMVEKGQRYLRSGRVQQAVEAFEEALSRDAANLKAAIGAAEASLRGGDAEKALGYLWDAFEQTQDTEVKQLINDATQQAVQQLLDEGRQDDAIELVERAILRTESEVLQQLRAGLGPKVTVQPPAGSYEGSLTITLASEGERIYYSLSGAIVSHNNISGMDGEGDPYTGLALYTGPITVSGEGSYQLTAAAATARGNLGPATAAEYTLTIPVDAITWEDPMVEAGVRQLLNRPDGVITRSELTHITALSVVGSYVVLRDDTNSVTRGGQNSYSLNGVSVGPRGNLATLADFRHFENLETLYVHHQNLATMAGAERLTQVRRLVFSGTNITDIGPVAGMPQLEGFGCWDGGLADLAPLEGMTSLTFLTFADTAVTDLTPLASLENLEELIIQGCKGVTDLTPLKGLENLRRVNAGNTGVTNWGPVDHVEEVVK